MTMQQTDKKVENVFQLSRKVFESDIWFMPPHYLKIWIWLLGKAAWRDFGNLKRGQLVTSYDDTIEATKWRVGYRTERLSYKQIRDVYGWLTKGNMAVTTKVKKGILVTICNYDSYQLRKKHEGQHEGHTKGKGRADQKRILSNTNTTVSKTTTEIPSNSTTNVATRKTNELPPKKETPASIARKFFKAYGNPELQAERYQKYAARLGDELDDFVSYWTEQNKSGTKANWELCKTWELPRRIGTWMASDLRKSKRNGSHKLSDAEREALRLAELEKRMESY